jgi:hypothetical protein
MKCVSTSVLALLMALSLSCRTVPVSEIRSIEVPGDLSEREVEFAILAALADAPPPGGLSPGLEITDRALEAWFGWRYKALSDRQERWFLEGREPGSVLAGYQLDEYYVRLSIDFDASQVSFRIVETRNLPHCETRVHRSVIEWITELEMEIRRSLGQVSVQPRLSGAGVAPWRRTRRSARAATGWGSSAPGARGSADRASGAASR